MAVHDRRQRERQDRHGAAVAETDIGNERGSERSFISPHKDFDVEPLPERAHQSYAEVAYNSTAFLFDGSDQMPGEVGAGTFWQEMTAWISGQQDLDTTLPEHRRQLAELTRCTGTRHRRGLRVPTARSGARRCPSPRTSTRSTRKGSRMAGKALTALITVLAGVGAALALYWLLNKLAELLPGEVGGADQALPLHPPGVPRDHRCTSSTRRS